MQEFIDYLSLFNALAENGAEKWSSILPEQLERAFENRKHGDLQRWIDAVECLPEIAPSIRVPSADMVKIGAADDINETMRNTMRSSLFALHPWRKGPFDVFGIHIDSEWRSDLKWNRLKDHIFPLRNRRVLDVGCGNGYHCWRMLGEGARLVVGIDPTLLSVMQFQVIRKLYGEAPIYVLPLGIEDLPYGMRAFDTVFSMGVLYHRRSPVDHLMELRDSLQPGGQLILETLVIHGSLGETLMPESRYAKMRNVWFIPSCDTLVQWMKRCGYKDIKLVDVTKTGNEEQRSTEWMHFHSLSDFLDTDNEDLTVEGLPAPVRAILTANT